MTDIDLSDIQNDLTEEEMAILQSILAEVAETGTSQSLNDIWSTDYEEMPVDIRTFIMDKQYLGETFVDEEGNVLMYEYWINYLDTIFKPDSGIFECLSGDTKIRMLDGSIRTMEELYLDSSNGKVNYGYSYDNRDSTVTVGEIVGVIPTGVKDVYRITLDNERSFKCTSNHPVLCRDGKYRSIDSGLTEGTSLIPFRTYINKGTEYVYGIGYRSWESKYRTPTHHMVADWKYGGRGQGLEIHHKDHNHSNNDPRNLCRISGKVHQSYHFRRRWNSDKAPDISRNSKNFMNSEEGHALARNNLDKFNSLPREIKRDICSKNGEKGILNKALAIGKLCLERYGVLNEEVYTICKKEFYRTHPTYARALQLAGSYEDLLELSKNYNHKIISIEYVGKELVYDLEVKDTHNIALDCGVFVHNCAFSGAIGLGKSTIACAGMAYILHKLLCLKNPAKYYKLTKGSRIGIALFNISLSASYGVGYAKLQAMLQNSPWFLARGELRGLKDKTYYPGKDIDIVVGSKMEHFIGRDIFCMTGDTVIKTDLGYRRLDELAGSRVHVYSQSRYNQVVTREPCDVVLTKYVNEIYEIELEDGTVLKCTGDHKLMVADGTYKRVMDLSESDELMDTMYGYIYKTTDTLTGKVYIGAKTSYKFLPEYYGSGSNINKIFDERGENHHLVVELLDICYTPEELVSKEKYYIDKYDSCNPEIGLNILRGGQTRPISKSSRERLSISAVSYNLLQI